jgi:hypothetical protein
MRFNRHSIDIADRPFRRVQVRVLGLIAIGALVLSGAGCTGAVHLPAENGPECVVGDPLAGEWAGELTSTSAGASRRIEATFRPAGDDTYRASYRTSVGLGLPLQFDTRHHVTRNGNVLRIDEWRVADIPGLGDCRCCAVCSGALLVIHYRTADDSGIIHLQRNPTTASPSTPFGDLIGDLAAELNNGVRVAVR